MVFCRFQGVQKCDIGLKWVNNVNNTFLELMSGVPQGSVLGALLFDIFLIVLYLFITKSSLHNYADDDTLSVYSSDLISLKTYSLKNFKPS